MMAKDWEKLAGERGRPIATTRLGRAWRLGRVAGRVTGSLLASRVGGMLGGGPEAQLAAYRKNAERIVEAMGELKGAAMKVGQLLSADPDLIPASLAEKLIRLQRDAPPMSFGTVQAQLEAAFDRPIEQLFRYFDPDPVGSASIGQVHRAELFDGTEVAVKVQVPRIMETLESDLRNLRSLANVGRVFVTRARLDAFIREIREAITNETDYEQEARNLARFRGLLKEMEGVRVPRPLPELTRRTVLTMEFVKGEKLDDAVAAIEDAELRDQIINRFVRTFVWMFHELHLLHADPHPGNFLLDAEHNVVLLDFGCVRAFDPQFTDGVLRLLVAFWDDDYKEMEAIYRELGFGTPDLEYPSHEVMREYHHLILEPIACQAPFDFGGWAVHARIKRFLLRNVALMKLVPPAESLLYFRVVSGIKGFLGRMDARVAVRRTAEEMARRRGVLT